MSSKLFAFSRPLPAPFDKAKKKVKVSSKYGNGTEATLCSTVVKAVQAYFKCKDGSVPGAVGLCGTKGVAEYKSASGPEVYHLAVYDPMLASIYNKDTEMLETYAVRNNGQDGAAIMMSMLPALMADDEFRENLDALEIQYQGGYPDMGEATERMAILCDNAYRRINDSSCAAHLPTSIDGTGNVMRVSTTHIDSGNFRPDTVVAGMFTILANSTVPEKLEIKPATPHSDFVGKYVLDTTRVLTLVCAARGGGHHLQARQAVHRQGAAHAQFPFARPRRHGKDRGCPRHRCGPESAIYEVHLLCRDGDLRPDRPGVPRHGWAIHRRRRIGPAAGAAQGDGRHHL